jgi:hypothetical protein
MADGEELKGTGASVQDENDYGPAASFANGRP